MPTKTVPSGACFPRTVRLLKPSQFRRVFSEPKRSDDCLFTVLAVRSKGNPARLGMAVSKKCAKKAVERNRLKRIIRESFRVHRGNLSEYDVVVMCRPKTLLATNAALRASLLEHWQFVNQDRQCAKS